MSPATTTTPLSQAQLVRKIISGAIAKLKKTTDEQLIKSITTKAWMKLEELVPNENAFRKIRKELREALENAFPASALMQPGYYFTKLGKGKGARYEHLSLWYATTNKDRWEVVGDSGRAEYFKSLPLFKSAASPTTTVVEEVQLLEPEASPLREVKSQKSKVKTEEVKPEQVKVKEPEVKAEEVKLPEVKPEEVKPIPAVLEIESMTVESLKLDDQTQEMVSSALAQSGTTLAEFIQQACRVYARTVTGKARKYGQDLTNVSTRELRDNKSYSTNPNRADELVNRAIRAVMLHNGQATEASHKWFITQTLLSEMSGSKVPSIKKIMLEKKGVIDDHNQQLRDDYEMTEYSNRKDKLVKEQFLESWVDIIPDGME